MRLWVHAMTRLRLQVKLQRVELGKVQSRKDQAEAQVANPDAAQVAAYAHYITNQLGNESCNLNNVIQTPLAAVALAVIPGRDCLLG
jgi:hypothetical protein